MNLSQMPSPSVSVVIPTFNRARFIGTAVQSVRDQGHACTEIVIVDDGSTDDTAQVVAALGEGIRYVKQANAGPAAARNRGILEATGDLVAFLDTDDRWLPDKTALQVDVLRRNPSVVLVSADMAIEDGTGARLVDSNFVLRHLQTLFADLDGQPVPDAPRLLLKVNYINTSTVLARRDVLLAMKGFDTRLRYGEDLELWLRIAARHAIACVPSVQEIRVEHASNVTKSIEPMLLGYVRMAEVIRGWAGSSMLSWGLSGDRYVAACLADLGYWYFSQGRMSDARQAMTRSMRAQPSPRALLYFLASVLPLRWIRFIQSAKSSPSRPRIRPSFFD
jgi:glycosyltransferase involved in cell wall biosynthesis